MPEPTPSSQQSLICCHDCGLLLRAAPLPFGGTARCPRCSAILFRRKRNGMDLALALNLTALLFFIPANLYPFLIFKMEGREQANTLITGVIEFADRGLWLLAILVFCATILMPFLKIVLSLYVLISVRFGRYTKNLVTVFRAVEIVHPWAMIEVYLLGVLVAIVKLSDIATIELDIALYSFIALIVAMTLAESSLEPYEVWNKLGTLRSRANPLRTDGPRRPGPRRALVACHACNLVSQASRIDQGFHASCRRCGARLHHRKPQSISWTWALVLTGFILYIPANLYPVMTVISFGKGEPDTILSGVKRLIEAQMWPLAVLVFFASVMVPMLKLFGLTFLLVTVQRGSRWRTKDRTVLYRVVEAVGRWSMIDIFMVSILIALVKLGSIATIEPGVGSTSFAAVVVVTMFAAMTFDPRLLWDAAGHNRE